VLAAHVDVMSSDEAYFIPRVIKEVINITESNLAMPAKIKSLTAESIG
jgi:hypothetical protein